MSLIGFEVITKLTHLGFSWKYWLGRFQLGVASLWLSLSPIHLFLLCILFGLLVVLSMLGALILGNHLACWLTTFC
jgi:hypothetical protein